MKKNLELNFFDKENEVLKEIAYCWKKGYRFAKIKKHLNENGFGYRMTPEILSNCFHKIYENGGLDYYLN